METVAVMEINAVLLLLIHHGNIDHTPPGAPLIIHPGRDEAAPAEIISILEAHGADVSRTVMSHLDRTIHDNPQLLQFARMGSLLEYDLFGMECSHYQVWGMWGCGACEGVGHVGV